MQKDKHEKPYFCPLMKKYFNKFVTGEQDCEIRPNKHRGWHPGNIYEGRLMTLSNGYNVAGRLTKKITSVSVVTDLKAAGVPQWHIEAVEDIYGKREQWLIAYV